MDLSTIAAIATICAGIVTVCGGIVALKRSMQNRRLNQPHRNTSAWLAIFVIAGVVIAGGLIYLFSVSQTETVTFPLKAGFTGVTTKHSYTGTTTIKVSGTGQVAAKFYSDAFWMYANDKRQPIPPQHSKDFLSLCIDSQPVDQFLQKIPLLSDTHTYTFQINAPGGRLTFGICDNGVNDNTGAFTVTISQGIFAIFT